jgi:hypothetical protein
MKRLLIATAIALALIASASAQDPRWGVQQSPGWQPTGGWQCKGGLVRVTTSVDGLGGVDFYVAGAWFR